VKGKRAVALLFITFAACGGGSSSSGSREKVPEVVSGSTWSAVTVHRGSASAEAPANLREDITPLLATGRLDRPGPLAEYGLDHPRAALPYTGKASSSAEVDVGQPNFDRHFVYVQRRGRPAVYLVPADTLRPALALVGIDLKPPE